VDCALALGFEQMTPGALVDVYTDRTPTLEALNTARIAIQGDDPSAPMAAQFFGGAGREYALRCGTRKETFAMISVKSRKHAAHNPDAVFRDPLTIEQVLESKHVYGLLTRLQCCPPTCGAAAAVVCSEQFAARRGAPGTVRIMSQSFTTDSPKAFNTNSMVRLVGYDMTVAASRQTYESAGVGPADIDVVELHDCFTANELISYEALGLVGPGEAERMVVDGDNTYGGRVVVNPSGGLLSKGHPLGATGLAQTAELVRQLRGAAGARQVEGARFALAHNLGLGGACVVTLFGKV
jgi:acetyl-CoA acetyltransferase